MKNDPSIPSPIDTQMAARPVSPSPLPTAPVNTTSMEPLPEFLQSKLTVLAMLFCVTGVLGVPLLWMNRDFSRTERVVWAIVVTIYTAILIAITVSVVMWAYHRAVG